MHLSSSELSNPCSIDYLPFITIIFEQALVASRYTVCGEQTRRNTVAEMQSQNPLAIAINYFAFFWHFKMYLH